jgi:ethanolamine utilization protein EutA
MRIGSLAPEVKVTQADIIYQSAIHFTPLISRTEIDLPALKTLVATEYALACFRKEEIATGAIIITGETARKDNAEEVLNVLAEFAGDFVVATAGPDLEGILAGFGAGAASQSDFCTGPVMNLDIGGGTTNAAIFVDGKVVDCFALDIGGRLIQFDFDSAIIYIAERLKPLLQALGLEFGVGSRPKVEELSCLTDYLAAGLIAVCRGVKVPEFIEELFIQHVHKRIAARFIMFSGGVAEYIYRHTECLTLEDVNFHGDIGPLLGRSIRVAFEKLGHQLIVPKEKIRATVIGTGTHSLQISGSTIVFDDAVLPLRNVPVIKINPAECADSGLCDIIRSKIQLHEPGNVAIAFAGIVSPAYSEIKKMAEAVVMATGSRQEPLVMIIEQDWAKALGQTIRIMLNGIKPVICLDRIKADYGNYIDIGKSIGQVVPVVIKTLVFKS